MISRRIIATALMALNLSANLSAAELGWLHGGLGGRWPNYVSRCGCGDDYCAKPLPQLPCPVAGTCCDDYCSKPMPKFCPVKGCCPDDYCPKPPPSPLCPTCYKCVPLPPYCPTECARCKPPCADGVSRR